MKKHTKKDIEHERRVNELLARRLGEDMVTPHGCTITLWRGDGNAPYLHLCVKEDETDTFSIPVWAGARAVLTVPHVEVLVGKLVAWLATVPRARLQPGVGEWDAFHQDAALRPLDLDQAPHVPPRRAARGRGRKAR